MNDAQARGLRWFWMLLFGFAILVVIGATAYSLRATYQYLPAFEQLGLDPDVDEGQVQVVVTRSKGSGSEAPEGVQRIVAVNGAAIGPDVLVAELAGRLTAAAGPRVAITLQGEDGRRTTVQQQRKPVEASPQERRASSLRVYTRIGFALFACSVLLLCSLLLALRRPDDPVAMIFALIFALMAASVDPALQMWQWMGLSLAQEWLASAWFYLLLIALAVFPDGVFVPRFLRWMVYAALPMVVFAGLPGIDPTLQTLVAVFALLALLSGQVIRYRRLDSGIERQQIKWAAFGFAAGFLLLAAAFTMVPFIPEDATQQNPLFNLLVLVLFSLGIACIPLGLLLALTRFRLWEADTVITRSAAYAVVTLIVGVVWAATSDLAKLIIAEVMGRESEAGATAISAMIAAGVFSPTQSAVLGWTRRHFGGPMDRIRGAAERLKSWGLTEAPAELAQRALGIVEEAVHPLCAAIEIKGPQGTEVLALRNMRSGADPKLLDSLDLADEEGSVGTLRLGRRSDGNRYNRQELGAVRELIPHIADALRVALGRHSRESMLQQQIEAMAARLAQLEGGTPKPA
jgi:hypothetical protein